MSITISFTHNGTTTTQTVALADTQRMSSWLAAQANGADGYFASIVEGMIAASNRWAADQAAQSAAQNVSPVLPNWTAGLWMNVGSRWRHNGQTWRVKQSHRSQSDWQPQLVPALFELVPTNVTVWAAGVQYAANQEVTHLGLRYRCIQAHTSQVGWEPPVTPSLWAQVA